MDLNQQLLCTGGLDWRCNSSIVQLVHVRWISGVTSGLFIGVGGTGRCFPPSWHVTNYFFCFFFCSDKAKFGQLILGKNCCHHVRF